VSLTRDDLVGFVDRYLEAMVAHEPNRIAAPDCRYTENFQTLSLGQGMWRTATGRKPGGHYFTDPASGQVGFFGVVTEIGGPATMMQGGDGAAMIALRLKVEHELITGAEALAVRSGGVLFNPDRFLGRDRSHFMEAVPQAERLPRRELTRISNLYFEAIEQNNGDLVPVTEECARVENGMQTTRNPDAQTEVGRMGVAEQMNSGGVRHIAGCVQRRLWAVDEEHQTALWFFFFDHPGDLGSIPGRVPFGYPNYMPAVEAFKIRSGVITHIEALIDIYPYGISSGW